LLVTVHACPCTRGLSDLNKKGRTDFMTGSGAKGVNTYFVVQKLTACIIVSERESALRRIT
jgi:hypothetical protein